MNQIRRLKTVTPVSRNRGIDGFRGIAILLVVIFHWTVRWSPPNDPGEMTRCINCFYNFNLYSYRHHFPDFLHLGRYGVQIFFIISGLVIAMTAMRSRDALDFCVRRLVRLYPPFIIAVLFTFCISKYGPAEFHTDWLDLLASLTMIPADLHRRAVDGVYWSLGIEVKFYAIVAFSRAMFGPERFWVGPALVAAASSVAHISGHGANILFADYWPYFIFGMALWYGLFKTDSRIAIALFLESILTFTIDHPSDNIACGMLIVFSLCIYAILRWAPNSHILSPLAGVGRFSYSIYLIHQFVGVMLIRFLVAYMPDFLAVASTALVVGTLAWILYQTAEVGAHDKLMSLYRAFRAKLTISAVQRLSPGPSDGV